VNITENNLVSDISIVNMVKLIINVLNKMIIISFLFIPKTFFLSLLNASMHIPALNQQHAREFDSIANNLNEKVVI
jgi:hypothetical protein